MTTERYWMDRWCFSCHALRRFARDETGVWRCVCATPATEKVAKQLDAKEAAFVELLKSQDEDRARDQRYTARRYAWEKRTRHAKE